MAGDIVVIERLKTHQNVYAYLCERPGYDMTKRTELDGFIAKAGKRADCKLKQFEGDFQLKLYNTQKEHTALSPIRLVRLNYVDPYGQAGEAGNEVPQTVCKKSTSKMAKKLKLGINDSDRDLKKAYERRIDAEVFMMKNIRQR